MSDQREVNIALDAASQSAFEQLPRQRYRPLDMKISLITPASDLETWPGDCYRMAVLRPIEPINPTGVPRSGVKDRRSEISLRDFRWQTMRDSYFQTSHPIPPSFVPEPLRR
jgi:hypothetical protein